MSFCVFDLMNNYFREYAKVKLIKICIKRTWTIWFSLLKKMWVDIKYVYTSLSVEGVATFPFYFTLYLASINNEDTLTKKTMKILCGIFAKILIA